MRAWLLLALLMGAGLTQAQPATRSALIVGVGNYASPEVPSLEGVPFDIVSARTIARAMGIPDQRITVLRDEQATKEAVLVALEKMAASITPGSRAFVYFSGHGTRWYEPALKGCKEGLLTYDRGTITNEEIASRTRRMSEVADKVVVLFDACHSDGVSTNRGRTRSMNVPLTPKFYLKGGEDAQACSQPVNLRTRSLLTEATKLGALQENFVQITSSRADEVSFDEPGKGGLATQGVRDCLLSRSTDTNGSGATTVEEIQRCAQRFVDAKLKPFPDLRPHNVTVSGNRNIVPVAVVRPPPPVASPAPVVAPAPAPPPPPVPVSIPAPVATAPVPAPPAAPTVVQPAPAPLPVAAAPVPLPPVAVAVPPPPLPPPAAVPPPTPQPAVPAAVAAPQAPPGSPPAPSVPPPSAAPTPPPAAPPSPPPEPALASLATLKDIEAQRNPRRQVDVTVSKPSMRIGKDALELTVRSSHDGHLYLVMIGSDAKSFYVLFPNGLDGDNRIQKNKVLRLPRPDWKLMAQGPAGTNHLLVVVADTPRDLSALTQQASTSTAPFTFSLNDLPGRSALFDFIAGRGVTGSSETFGAKLLSVKEVP